MAGYVLSFDLWTTILLIILVYPLVRIIHNLYFHPLSNIQHPRSSVMGSLHEKYGPIIRVAPNGVTLAHPDAYTDIGEPRPEQNRRQFPKDPLWFTPALGHPDSLGSAMTFAPRALRVQEPFVQKYVNLLVTQLQDLVKESKSSQVNMTPWFNYTTFDIFGDLGFGGLFDCLQHAKYHSWIAMLFDSFKAFGFFFAARQYPLIEFILVRCVPPSMRKAQQDHYQQIVNKAQRRLSWELQRPDIMSPLIDENGALKLDAGELYSTFMVLTIAGSETTATALTGTLNYLVHTPESLRHLETEIRKFSSLEDITLDAVHNLQFLNAVLHEGLRLCSPVPWILPRLVPEGGEVICGTWLPGGTFVSTKQYTLNRDPNLFHQSTTFLPERWSKSSTSNPTSCFFKDQRQVVQPFNVGPHACIGQALAWAEMRLVLAKLVFAFDFAVIEGQRVRWEDLRTYLLVERKPINVRIKLREVNQPL
ncbi:cytochrome P450 [Aspergillus californicus]